MSKRAVARGFVLLAFILSTLSLTVGTDLVNSPDENANVQFAEAFAQTGKMELIEPLNASVGGVIHARSMVAIGERIVPRSFLGLTALYGAMGSLTSVQVIPYLTPLLALVALLAWWDIVRVLFRSDDLADLSTLFVMVHPAFWHYSARTMMHNVPFVALLIIGAWFLIRRPKQWWVNALVGGFFIGLALAFRTSELLWVGGGLFAVLAAQASTKRDWVTVPIVAIGLGVALLPFAFLNQQTYGDALTTGYTVQAPIDQAVNAYEGDVEVATAFEGVLGVLFPFGIHEKAILRHVWQYGFLLYPWMSLLAVIGLVLSLASVQKKKQQEPWYPFAVVTLCLAVWLAIVYGSWSFHDNPDPNIISVGNSYVRYWLPLFVLSSVFAAQAVFWLAKYVVHKRIRKAFVVFVVGACVLASAQLVVHDDDGFVATRHALQSFAAKRLLILDQTEEDAVIIVDRADKYLFPDRRVVVPLRDERTYAAMPNLVDQAPLYYFGITFPMADIDYLNEEKLGNAGLAIEAVMTIDEETLYRIQQAQ